MLGRWVDSTRSTASLTASIVVQHHPRRAHLLSRFAPLDPAICTDQDPDGPARPWDTYRECLTQPGEHLVILQDDALPAIGFTAAVDAIITAHPSEIICLYHGRHPHHTYLQMLRAAEACQRYARIDPVQWLPLVGVIWPGDLANQAAGDIGDPALGYADDGLIAAWMHKHQLTALVTIPNIVQHDDSVPTLMRMTHTRSSRSAQCWIGAEDASLIDWRA